MSSTLSRVLVAAEDFAAGKALTADLEELGFACDLALGDGAARALAADHAFDVLVLDIAGGLRRPAALARDLRAACRPRMLAVVVLARHGEEMVWSHGGFDAVVAAPAHPAQLAARIRLVTRLAVMEDEARLRANTLAARGVKVDLALDRGYLRPPQVLYAGSPSPHYLGYEAALTDAGAELVAAFTTFTAFDYLHERDFDAVIVNGMRGVETAFSICGALRRNTRLYHVPALLFVDESFEKVDEAFARGFSDVLSVANGAKDLARRTLNLVRERRRREAIKAAFAQIRDPAIAETDTGLATATFFAKHLDAMANRARQVGRPLSLVVARASIPRAVEPDERAAAMRQLGSMTRHLVRAEDLAARLEGDVFAVAMPGADATAAKEAAARLEGVAECTAFDGGPFGDTFQIGLVSAAEEMRDDDTSLTLLRRAVASFEKKTRTA